jgi:hypothetical protein
VSIRDEKKGVYNVYLYKKYPRLYEERIGKHIPTIYYIVILALAAMLLGVFLQSKPLMLSSFVVWSGSTLFFSWKRLKNTRKTLAHVTEMLFTSMVIPVLSLYYRGYGIMKYRVLMF